MTAGTRSESAREAARDAGLRYVSDEEPGIRRRRCGKGFTYLDPEGETVREEKLRERIEDMVIPPGWSDVWICRRPDGHIQATGRDDAGRKQYIYHSRWRVVREQEKYRRLEELGGRLPVLRQRVGRDLSRDGLSRRRVVAGAVRLLDRASMRVGYECYAEANDSFGVTTLRARHVKVSRDRARFRFQGKGGKDQDVEVRDAAVAKLLAELRAVPGEEIFVFREDGDRIGKVAPDDVNRYLRDVTRCDISAKDFRTWSASVRALRVLARSTGGRSEAGNGPDPLLAAVDAAAELLGNTRSTAREFYIHPGLLRAYEDGRLGRMIESANGRSSHGSRRPGYRRGETLFLALLPRLAALEAATS